MKNVAVLMFALLAVLFLPADDYPTMDITNIYGQTIKDAKIVNVNASTVDITYIDSYNMPVMRGIKLKDLTPELQAKFGYDPATAAENERKQAELRQNQFNQLKYQETQLQKKISLQVQQRQGGQDVPIDLGDLYKVIYQSRVAVSGFVISYGKEGALVNVTGNDNDNQQIGDNIIILDLDAPARSNWAGYVYPTMMVSSQRLGVYCISPENAIDSVVATLKLDNNAPASGETVAANTAAAAQAADGGSSAVTTTTTTGSGYSGIYIQTGGGYYYPSNVYPVIIPPYVRPWPRPPWPRPPYPPRPYPPRPYPPRPPHDHDDHGDHGGNNWPNRPGQDNNNNNNNWPNRPGQDNNNNNNNNSNWPNWPNRPGQDNNNNNRPNRTGVDSNINNNLIRPGQDNNTNNNINSWSNRNSSQSGGDNRGAGDRSNVAMPGTGSNVIIPGSGNYVPAGTGVPGSGWGNGWRGGDGSSMRR